MYLQFLLALSAIPFCVTVAPPGPWDKFNFAPQSKIVRPGRIRSVDGQVQGATGLLASSGKATIAANGSFVVLDFLQEVGGRVSFNIDQASSLSGLALSFTESPEFISPHQSDDSCHASITMDSDGVQALASPMQPGTFLQTTGQQRGGFRYLTIVSTGSAPVTISNVTVHITFMPHWEDLRAYTGYFSALDESGFHDVNFLTKLWYAGAYTVQTNTIDAHEARQQPCPSPQGWANNASGGPVEGPILVDGAKRDRNIWPGDMGISSHTELVALNDLLPTKNALAVMFSTQDPATGALQYSGPPINAKGSDTYIGWSLIGTHNYFLYTGDLEFVQSIWSNYTKALSFLQSQVDGTGLMNVPLAFANDWGRDGGQGHNSAANVILYRALVTATDLASHLGQSTLAELYSANATALKHSFNALLWDNSAGMFRDNDTSSLHPQDGNSLAILFNITTSTEQNRAISAGLTQFWTDIGPLSPELNDTIIPFVGGFEVGVLNIGASAVDADDFCKVQAHFIAGEGERGLDLLRKGTSWGYMLYTNLSVQSTLLEGFTTNGSLGYRAAAGYEFDHAYTSHSHGWATGPTPALTFFVLGLTLTSPKGSDWQVAPVLSGLNGAEGGFETELGWFGVKWHLTRSLLTVTLNTPKGTTGRVIIPGTGPVTAKGEKDTFTSEDAVLLVNGGNWVLTRRQS